MTDPLRELIATALELMNHSFAPPGDVASARLEFYHQFRKLWDRGIPVGMGLGHLLLKSDGDTLRIERIGEKGVPGATLAVISFDGPAAGSDRIAITHDGRHWRMVV
jgi:hypothetical protein